jgi:Domain of unknown function (DUF1904)
MPQLWTRHIPVDTIRLVARPLIQEMAEICACGTDNFSIEIIEGTSISFEPSTAAFPFIEIRWFDRGKDVQDRLAHAITRHLLETGRCTELEIAFIPYAQTNYYINGEDCAQ